MFPAGNMQVFHLGTIQVFSLETESTHNFFLTVDYLKKNCRLVLVVGFVMMMDKVIPGNYLVVLVTNFIKLSLVGLEMHSRWLGGKYFGLRHFFHHTKSAVLMVTCNLSGIHYTCNSDSSCWCVIPSHQNILELMHLECLNERLKTHLDFYYLH